MSNNNNTPLKYRLCILKLVILSMDYVTVSAGSIDTSSDVLVRSSKLIIHKDYNTGDKKYDIGLIKVMTPFTFNGT
jgi:hypothetical protein